MSQKPAAETITLFDEHRRGANARADASPRRPRRRTPVLIALGAFVGCTGVGLGQGTGRGGDAPPEAVLRLTAEWRAHASVRQGKTTVEDHIVVTYRGELRAPLVSSSPRDPNMLSTPRNETGQATCSVEGGGSGDEWSWEYSAGPQKPTVPRLAVDRRRGTFSFLLGEADNANPGGGCDITVRGRLGTVPWEQPGPAQGLLALLEFDRLDKVGAEVRGTFEPFSESVQRSGTFSGSVTRPEGGGTWRIDYELSFGAVADVEAVMWVEKADEEWLPSGSTLGEKSSGDFLKVLVKLHPKDDPEGTPAKKARFRFVLEEVSSEPGVCINWPPQGETGAATRSDPDLAFEKKANPELDVEAEWNTDDGRAGERATTRGWARRASVVVSSFDYGGHGTLRVFADLEGGGTVAAHLQGNRNAKSMNVPRDDNGNGIADIWERWNSIEGARANGDDEDDPPTDRFCSKGDGFSVYEEYRGAFIDGKHRRLLPNRRELFVSVQFEDAKPGVEFFADKSGIIVYSIRDAEMRKDRVVNSNHGPDNHVVDQHGLRVIGEKMEVAAIGFVEESGPPKEVSAVVLDQDYLQRNPGAFEKFKGVVAHELGHAVGMRHHGLGDFKRAFKEGELGLSAGEHVVAVQGGEHSGVENCIMRYREAKAVQLPDGRLEPYDGGDPRMDVFCDSKGPNPRTGDAAVGRCRRQICLSDLETPAH